MQILINGLISGMAIALLAVAFQLVYLPTKVFFISLGGIYALAPYLCMALLTSTGTWWLAAPVSLLLLTCLAMSFEYFNHAPLTRKGASDGAHLVSSLGIYILLVQLIAMLWGNNTHTLRLGVDATWRFSDVVLTHSQLLLAGIGSAALLAFLLILYWSDMGLRLRALADNPIQFALYGHNISLHRYIAFALAGMFGTLASLLTALDGGFTPYTGLQVTLLAVVSVIIGGRSFFLGPVIGGLLLGVIRAQVVWQLSPRWQEAVTFLLMALFLLLRPNGIFKAKSRIEAGNT